LLRFGGGDILSLMDGAKWAKLPERLAVLIGYEFLNDMSDCHISRRRWWRWWRWWWWWWQVLMAVGLLAAVGGKAMGATATIAKVAEYKAARLRLLGSAGHEPPLGCNGPPHESSITALGTPTTDDIGKEVLTFRRSYRYLVGLIC